ncbi:MAG: hypothetical protein ABFS30_10785 [Pseudomonadota bacterium]
MTERWRAIVRWAALGALSGTLATLAIFVTRWLNFYDALEGDIRIAGFGLSFSPLSVAPGLVFGLVLGYALRREGLASGGRYAVYILAAGLSYFVTVQVTLNILIDMLDNVVLIGVAAGAIGAALLAAATAALIPDFQQRRPMNAMILAGTVLGATLFFAISSERFFGWFLLFAPWQAGYAAAMATALKD